MGKAEPPCQELPCSADATWVAQRPLLRLQESSIEGHVAPCPLQVAVWQLKALFARLGVGGLLIPHQLIVLISRGLFEYVVLWHSQGTDL